MMESVHWLLFGAYLGGIATGLLLAILSWAMFAERDQHGG